MAKITRDARVLLKRATASGEVPIPGIGDDHTTWVGVPSGSSMIYNGETFVNPFDSRLWTRMTGITITEHTLFDNGYIPSGSQVMYLKNGHMTGSPDMVFDSGTNTMNITNLSSSNTTITNLNVSGPMQMINIEYGAAPYALFYNNSTSAVTYYDLHIDAGTISYHNPTYPTVESALDHLLYVFPSASLTDGTNIFEIGTIITTVHLNWSVNKSTMTSTIITGTNGYSSGQLAPTQSGSVTNSPISLSTNTTYTINTNDGTNPTSASFGISFYRKAFWGTGTAGSAPVNSTSVRALSNNMLLSSSNTGTFSITITIGQTGIWFFIPAGKTVVVQYVESSYADVTSSFVTSPITVNDAGGNTQSYTSYVSSITGYPSTAHYNVTIT